MRRQESRLLFAFFTASAIAVACAGEQQDPAFDEVESGGSSGRGGGKGGGASTAGTSSSGKGGKGGAGGGGGGSGGSSGSSGSAGTTTPGGATGSEGGAPAGGGGSGPDLGECDVGGASFGGGVVSVEYQTSSLQASNYPAGTVQVINDSGSSVASSEFALRYYFTSEFPCDEADGTTVEVYDFRRQMPHDDSIDKGDVAVSTVVVGESGDGCDVYFEFVFTLSLADQQYAVFNWGSKPPNDDYTSHPGDQTNDSSFGACATMGVPWTSTPLYVDGELAWGEEPDLGGGGAGAGGGASSGGAGGANPAGAGGAAGGLGGAGGAGGS